MKEIKLVILFLMASLTGCSSLTLQPAEFSWPVESVLKVKEDGFVKEERYSFNFNTKELFLEETKDSSAYQNKEIRIIRNSKGFYFITSDNFKNVYVFNVYNGRLRLENKIEISETGINKPAFNQRPPYVELIEGSNRHLLSHEGIIEEEDEE